MIDLVCQTYRVIGVWTWAIVLSLSTSGCGTLLYNVPLDATAWNTLSVVSNPAGADIWANGGGKQWHVGTTPWSGAYWYYAPHTLIFQGTLYDGRVVQRAFHVPPIPSYVYLDFSGIRVPGTQRATPSPTPQQHIIPAVPIPEWNRNDIIELPQRSNWIARLASLQLVMKTVKQSVVTLKVPGGHGAGFVVHNRGLVMTNYHVVKGANTVIAQFLDGREVEGTVVRTDQAGDFALVKLEDGNYPAISLGSIENLEAGQEVYAVGTPLDPALGHSVTRGIVSGLRKVANNLTLIQTDAAINPGNSGGPLVDRAGRVLGITTSGIDAEGVEGLAFATSIDNAKERLGLR